MSLTVKTGSDFLGFETAYYSVDAKSGRIAQTSVEASLDGKPAEPRQAPLAKGPFPSSQDARFVRLVFLTRSSDADHDMAVLTARRQADLDVWTLKLKADPEGACRAAGRYCSWIPGGIAVTPERPDAATGKWGPADNAGHPRS